MPRRTRLREELTLAFRETVNEKGTAPSKWRFWRRQVEGWNRAWGDFQGVMT